LGLKKSSSNRFYRTLASDKMVPLMTVFGKTGEANMVAISCPHCGKVLNVPQEKIGKVGRCPECRESFTATASAPAPIPAKVEEVDEEKLSPVLIVGQSALKTTQAIGGGLVKAGSAALEWNKARQEEKARREQEIALREQERIEAEATELAKRIEEERAELAKPIPCPFCGEPVARQARKCRHCNEYLDVNLRPGAQPAPQPQIIINNANTNTVQSHSHSQSGATAAATVAIGGARRRKRFSPLVACLLSILLPGLGQIYTGRLLAGIVWFLLVLVGYICFIVPGIVLHVICAISAGMTNPYK
jgi:TM2 domain-containing membrane protein YozV/predicted RNA-binding Zn-ribbon protein involved in translation (DUF1610 family)